MEKKLFWAAVIWTVLGLAGGVYYREFTRVNGFDTVERFTQLTPVHVHCLVLGTVFMLLALLLERTFGLSKHSKRMSLFLLLWSIGLAMSVGMQIVKGTLQVLEASFANHAAIAGLSGLGHIVLTCGFIWLLAALKPALEAPRHAEQE